MSKELDRCLKWALKDLSEHEAWGVRQEIYAEIERARRSQLTILDVLKIRLDEIQSILRLAKKHEQFLSTLPLTQQSLKEQGVNSVEEYVKASKKTIIEYMIREAGSAEEAGINIEGEEFHPDHDCPKCGKELDEEYGLCECGYFRGDGMGDILADRRAGK